MTKIYHVTSFLNELIETLNVELNDIAKDMAMSVAAEGKTCGRYSQEAHHGLALRTVATVLVVVVAMMLVVVVLLLLLLLLFELHRSIVGIIWSVPSMFSKLGFAPMIAPRPSSYLN